MTELKILESIAPELSRFQKKLAEAIAEQRDKPQYHGSRQKLASVKRSAMDLKNELTKITQMSNYDYRKRNGLL